MIPEDKFFSLNSNTNWGPRGTFPFRYSLLWLPLACGHIITPNSFSLTSKVSSLSKFQHCLKDQNPMSLPSLKGNGIEYTFPFQNGEIGAKWENSVPKIFLFSIKGFRWFHPFSFATRKVRLFPWLVLLLLCGNPWQIFHDLVSASWGLHQPSFIFPFHNMTSPGPATHAGPLKRDLLPFTVWPQWPSGM